VLEEAKDLAISFSALLALVKLKEEFCYLLLIFRLNGDANDDKLKV
jgi:hypothetical protein